MDSALPTWYSNNMTQLILMSLVVFACPGMFNALNSIGLGGDPSIGNLVNCSLYGTWMITSFFAPTVVNILKAKWSLLLGTLGYPVYALAMYYHRRWWGVAAGAFLGLTAGLLWTAQGQLMMSYPERRKAGRFVAIFWGIFNSGGVLGCLLSFLLNIEHSSEGAQAVAEQEGGSSLTASTYWTFFVVMCAGSVLAVVVLPLDQVTFSNADGQVECVVGARPSSDKKDAEEASGLRLVSQELQRTMQSFSNKAMLCLIPLFFYSNFFYSYHFGVVGILLNGRTGSLTMATYWVAQIMGSFLLQGFLDQAHLKLEYRLRMSFLGTLVYITLTWVFGGFVQYGYGVSEEHLQSLDLVGHQRSPWPAMLCIFLWGFVDSFVQVWSYWFMTQLSSEPEELACFTAFYKLWQCAGSFLAFLASVWFGKYELEFWINIVLIALLVAPTLCAICLSDLQATPESASPEAKLDEGDGVAKSPTPVP